MRSHAIRDRVSEALRSPGSTVLWLFLVSTFVWAYGGILLGIIRSALGNPLWYHCLIVPFASAWALYRKRHEIAAAPLGHSWGGGALFLVLSGLFLMGEIGAGGFFFGGAALVFGIAAIAVILQGWSRFRAALFPIALLAMAIPVPSELVGFVGFRMQNISAMLTTVTCNMVGIPVGQEGIVLVLGDFRATIAESCSGQNSLVALFMCGAWIAGFARVTGFCRLLMLASIGPLVLVANVLRLVLMMVIALFFGGDVALGFFHEGSDLILFLILVGFLIYVRAWLERDARVSPPSPPPVEWSFG